MRFYILSALAFLPLATPVSAGVMADDLSRCMISKATDEDKSAFMAWMFSAISADPKLQKFTTLDRAQRDKLATGAANVFQRLLLVDCRKESVAVLKAEGVDAMVASFGGLGEAATEAMFRSPQAQAELDSLGKNFDQQKLKSLSREAGIPDDQDKK